jgi:hypothetical protein
MPPARFYSSHFYLRVGRKSFLIAFNLLPVQAAAVCVIQISGTHWAVYRARSLGAFNLDFCGAANDNFNSFYLAAQHAPRCNYPESFNLSSLA